MKRYVFIFLILPKILFSDDFLKAVLFTNDKEFIKEFLSPDIPEIFKFPIKEGFVLYYPDGKPPIVYKFKENSKELVFEEKNLKKYDLNFKECEYLGNIEGFFILKPEKEIKGFPFPKEWYFLLIKNSKEVFLREGNYEIEELNGKYFYPENINFNEKKEIVFYPSFKTEIIIEDSIGQRFEKCKSKIDFSIQSYGKKCSSFKEFFYKDGTKYFEVIPSNSNIKFNIYCEEAETFSKNFSSKEIGIPFIINLKRLGKIEGILKDEKERPVQNYSFSLFYGDEAIPLKETKTDKNGYFVFKGLKEGKYFLKDSPEYNFIGDKNIDIKTDTKNLNMIISQEKGSFRSSPGYDGTYFNEELYLKKGESKYLELEVPETKIWEGKVISEENQPLPDVYIFYKGKEIGKTNIEGKFKIELKGEKIDIISFSKEGYSVLNLKDIGLENLPEVLILKGLGIFKVRFMVPNTDSDLIPKLYEDLVLLKNYEEEIRTGFGFMYKGNEINFKVELEEGNYIFKINGINFKPYTSKPFTIYSGKEYDYGTLTLEMGEKKEKEKRQIKILVKNFQEQASPNASLIINIISIPEKENFMVATLTDENGVCKFESLYENFYYNFLYAESQDGFLFMEKEELVPFNNLNSFEIKLNPPNVLKIKIINLEPKKETYDLFLKFKNGVIKEKITYQEEKIYKNLISPIEIEISTEGETIWKEKIELKEGENILYL